MKTTSGIREWTRMCFLLALCYLCTSNGQNDLGKNIFVVSQTDVTDKLEIGKVMKVHLNFSASTELAHKNNTVCKAECFGHNWVTFRIESENSDIAAVVGSKEIVLEIIEYNFEVTATFEIRALNLGETYFKFLVYDNQHNMRSTEHAQLPSQTASFLSAVGTSYSQISLNSSNTLSCPRSGWEELSTKCKVVVVRDRRAVDSKFVFVVSVLILIGLCSRIDVGLMKRIAQRKIVCIIVFLRQFLDEPPTTLSKASQCPEGTNFGSEMLDVGLYDQSVYGVHHLVAQNLKEAHRQSTYSIYDYPPMAPSEGKLQSTSNANPNHNVTNREKCIKSLLESEKNYCKALQMIINYFIEPLGRGVLTKEDHSIIFMGIQDLYTMHSEFCAALQQTTGNSDGGRTIGQCFTEWKPKFLIYGEFCINLPKAEKLLDELNSNDESVQKRINECQKKAYDGRYQLQALLSIPMLRVLHYHLILKELMSNTDRSHCDRESLEQALEDMQDLSLYLNEVKKDVDALQHIQEIKNCIADLPVLEEHGKFIRQGMLKVKSQDSNHPNTRYVFLFDKVMLLCKPKENALCIMEQDVSYSYKNTLILSEYHVKDGNMSPHQAGQETKCHSFLVINKYKKGTYKFFAKTGDLKQKWIDAIRIALDNICPPGAKTAKYDFIMKSFNKPTICDACGKLLRGMFYQGYRCKKTSLVVHKECIPKPGTNNKALHCQTPRLPRPPCRRLIPKVAMKPSSALSPSGSDDTYISPDDISLTDLSEYSWFEGKMDRHQAAQRLMRYKEGTYLVRVCEDPGSEDKYVLSVKFGDGVKHFKILEKKDGGFCLTFSKIFKHIPELIAYYQVNSLGNHFPSVKTVLTTPPKVCGAGRVPVPPVPR